MTSTLKSFVSFGAHRPTVEGGDPSFSNPFEHSSNGYRSVLWVGIRVAEHGLTRPDRWVVFSHQIEKRLGIQHRLQLGKRP